MKQTAVEFLVEKMDIKNPNWLKEEIEQAKAMEEQQIIEAFIGYDSDTEDNLEVAEQYYNETFKSK